MASLTDARLAETRLGGTGRTVARIGLGAMHLSLPGRPEREAAKAVVRRAVELGVTLIDTADAYCIDQAEAGHNEGLVAEALREMGAGFGGVGPAGSPRVVVATKGGMVRPGGRWERDGRPVHLRGACEASLRTLGVERIDLYQFHAPDRAVPFSDSVGAIARLVEEGKVDAAGLSNVTVAQIREAQSLVAVASVQNAFGPWDVAGRPSPVVEYCREHGITFLAYGPLGGSGRVRALEESPALQRLAQRTGHAPAELVLALLLDTAPNIVPIPGASRVPSVESSVRAGALVLDPALAGEIRDACARLPGRHGFLRRAVAGALRRARALVGGG
jgi:aryl-alcohol dehydrogenase-like predicted oxidoreductase